MGTICSRPKGHAYPVATTVVSVVLRGSVRVARPPILSLMGTVCSACWGVQYVVPLIYPIVCSAVTVSTIKLGSVLCVLRAAPPAPMR